MRNRKAWLLIALLGFIVALFVYLNRRNTTLSERESAFAVADTSSITKIFMANKNNQELLLTREHDKWRVNNTYSSNQRSIDLFLATLKRLRVRSPVSRAAHDNVIKRMAAIGIKVEIYQNKPLFSIFGKDFLTRERLSKTYYVGDITKDNLGTYMLMDGADQAYVVYLPNFRGFVSSRYNPNPDNWRDYTIFSYELDELKSLQLIHGEEPYMGFIIEQDQLGNFTITRQIDQVQMKAYDTLKLLNYLTSFRDIRFEALLNSMDQQIIDSILALPPLYDFQIVDFQGDTSRLLAFEKKENSRYEFDDPNAIPVDLDRMYGYVNGNDFVLLQYFSFDRVIKPIVFFEPERK